MHGPLSHTWQVRPHLLVWPTLLVRCDRPCQVPLLGSPTSAPRTSLGWIRRVGFTSFDQMVKGGSTWIHGPTPNRTATRKWPPGTLLSSVSASHNHHVGLADPTFCGHTYNSWDLVPPTWELTCNQLRITDQIHPWSKAVDYKFSLG
jgi:hypothetical protein